MEDIENKGAKTLAKVLKRVVNFVIKSIVCAVAPAYEGYSGAVPDFLEALRYLYIGDWFGSFTNISLGVFNVVSARIWGIYKEGAKKKRKEVAVETTKAIKEATEENDQEANKNIAGMSKNNAVSADKSASKDAQEHLKMPGEVLGMNGEMIEKGSNDVTKNTVTDAFTQGDPIYKEGAKKKRKEAAVETTKASKTALPHLRQHWGVNEEAKHFSIFGGLSPRNEIEEFLFHKDKHCPKSFSPNALPLSKTALPHLRQHGGVNEEAKHFSIFGGLSPRNEIEEFLFHKDKHCPKSFSPNALPLSKTALPHLRQHGGVNEEAKHFSISVGLSPRNEIEEFLFHKDKVYENNFFHYFTKIL